ncbi:hypothetical protein [Hymenobacter volaticus]|uniref:WYL domain-containing protein n=1 Tax=Hymenobacter volaticus TaxID=2932254 RepID=A0ABY4GDQ0_9BACT|nr:hypothetical protein [Hymenobacter volaticus]UOQ68921.1 hypothetical protein MUN86_24765 [Hymenobacter volaticus]
MIREEAIRITLLYLTEKDNDGTVILDYQRMLASLTEYATCWYVDFHYKRARRQPPHLSGEAPGFIIDKKSQRIRVISWQELYELNFDLLPF